MATTDISAPRLIYHSGRSLYKQHSKYSGVLFTVYIPIHSLGWCLTAWNVCVYHPSVMAHLQWHLIFCFETMILSPPVISWIVHVPSITVPSIVILCTASVMMAIWVAKTCSRLLHIQTISVVCILIYLLFVCVCVCVCARVCVCVCVCIYIYIYNMLICILCTHTHTKAICELPRTHSFNQITSFTSL